jgi:SAM-dependent methyltransferase
MATVKENRLYWGNSYDWSEAGDEWSSLWGGPVSQWYGSLLPRVHRFVPADTVLEIACGYGRWTQFLKDLCNNLIVVDVAERCIEACKQRFAQNTHISYHVNDGKSLGMLNDESVDFVFSFDSLVHVDESVMAAYIAEVSRILKPNGAALLHHSNLGQYFGSRHHWRRSKLSQFLARLGIIENVWRDWRDVSVSANKIKLLAEAHGLGCIGQELIPWRTKKVFTDCISIMVRRGSAAHRENRVFENRLFMQEVRYLSQLAKLYDANHSR